MIIACQQLGPNRPHISRCERDQFADCSLRCLRRWLTTRLAHIVSRAVSCLRLPRAPLLGQKRLAAATARAKIFGLTSDTPPHLVSILTGDLFLEWYSLFTVFKCAPVKIRTEWRYPHVSILSNFASQHVTSTFTINSPWLIP